MEVDLQIERYQERALLPEFSVESSDLYSNYDTPKNRMLSKSASSLRGY
jgi:hypothetical protein